MIAAQLAMGESVALVKSRIEAAAPIIFSKPSWYQPPCFGIFRPKFDAGPLTREIQKIVGQETLETSRLKTGLAIVMKHMDGDHTIWNYSNSDLCTRLLTRASVPVL